MAKDRAQTDLAQDEASLAGGPDELWLKALKIFVMVTGVVLLFGTSAFVYLFLDKRESDRVEAEVRRVGPARVVEVPDGARIRDVQLENGRALVTLDGTDGREYLLYVDLADGERIGLVVLD